LQIISRLSISADGYVTTPDGWPAQLADPAFKSGESHTPALSPATGLTFERQRELPGGSVEIVYSVG
jgi:hypothetical protein